MRSARLLLAIGAGLALSSVALAQPSAPAPQQAEAITEEIVNAYVSMCIEGTLKVEKSQLETIGRGDLPPYLRDWYSSTPDGTYHRISTPDYTAYLVQFVRPETRGTQYRQACSVSTTYRLTQKAVALIKKAIRHPDTLTGDQGESRFWAERLYSSERGPYFDYDNPALGHNISLKQAGGRKAFFTVLQTSFFNETDRLRRIEESEKLMARLSSQAANKDKK